MFTHKVYEDLLHVKKNYDRLEVGYEKEQYMDVLNRCLYMLQRSHSFYLSIDSGDLDTVSLTGMDPGILKLPFKECMLELDVLLGNRPLKSCLFLEQVDDEARKAFKMLGQGMEDYNVHIMFSIALRYQRRGEDPHFMTAPVQGVIMERGGKVVYSVPAPDYADTWLNSQGARYIEENHKIGQMYCGAVIFFLRMLHAKNIETETIKNGSPSLNKKRAKRGKLPLRDYHVLKVRHSNGILSDVNITHNKTGEVRFHHVRGHFRTVMKGHGEDKKPEDVWVVPHVRGNKKKGKIRKDYTL